MQISLDLDGERPLYLQIADFVTGLAKSGQLRPDDRLPSSRALAASLGVHRSTVLNAYDELRARGVMVGVRGSGSYVADGLLDAPRPAPASALWPGRDALSEVWRLNRVPGVVSLALGLPPDDMLPSAELSSAYQTVLRREGAASFGGLEPQGSSALRAAIARDLSRHGIAATADDLVVTGGAQEALSLVARALAAPGDGALVEGLTFPGALLSLRGLGLRLQGFRIGPTGPDEASLEGAFRDAATHPRLVLASPDYHNPTGALWGDDERRRFLRFAGERALRVVENATYRDAHLGAEPPPPLRARDDGVVYIGSYSKSFAPGLRVGFVLADGALRRQLVSLKTAGSGGNETLSQLALALCLRPEPYLEHLRRTARVYARRRDALASALSERMPPGARWAVPAGGIYLWIELPERWPSTELFRRAAERGVIVYPAEPFAVGEAAPNAIRLCFARHPEDILRRAVSVIAEAGASIAPP